MTRWMATAAVLLIGYSPAVVRGQGLMQDSISASEAQWHAATAHDAAERLVRLLTGGDAASFEAAMPHADARQLFRWAAEYKWKLEGAGAGVLDQQDSTALIFVSAYPVVGNSGHETVLGQMFSGLYLLEQRNGNWRVGRKVPVDLGNRITARALDVELVPGAGLSVVDTMDVEVAGGHGLWLNMNRRAEVGAAVDAAGRPVTARKFGGLLHLDVPDGRQRIVLEYELDVARDGEANGNFSRFGTDFGHVRSHYFWHPMLDGTGGRDLATFRARIRAPAGVHVVSSIPQTDTVVNGIRHVTAVGARPVSSLSLFYDDGWRVNSVLLGGIRTEIFIGDGFEPEPSVFRAALGRVHEVLSRTYGEPAGGYQAVVQVRGASSYGWHFRSNDVIGSGHRGGALSSNGEAPAHFLGHEMAHNWTNPTGPGRLFLIEGWARFAESVLLREEYGAETEDRFWDRQHAGYLRGRHEGRNSLITDEFNNGISYEKGAWVLRMLRDFVGPAAFEQGMRTFIALPPDSTQDLASFGRIMSAASGRNVEGFLHPWLHDTRIAAVDVAVSGDSVVLSQPGAVFVLPLEVDVETDAGTSRKRILLQDRTASLRLPGQVIRSVVVDPQRRLLLRRED